jgi:hypothetical protein
VRGKLGYRLFPCSACRRGIEVLAVVKMSRASGLRRRVRKHCARGPSAKKGSRRRWFPAKADLKANFKANDEFGGGEEIAFFAGAKC